MAKKIDPQAKAKRQKIIAATLGVVLLAVLAFQLPRTLKMLHQSSASASPTATTTASTGTGTTGATGALAAADAGSTSTSASTGDGVNDPGVLPAPQSGQLLAFSRFRSKDPFTQQIDVNCGSDSGSSGGCGTGGTATPSGTGSGKPAKPSSTKPANPQTAAQPLSGATAMKPTSAEISVNGSTESLTVGAKFPASNPTFVLVSLTKSVAKIGIAGGSLEGGKQTVTLKKGVPLTLMNTADGTRFVLRLVSVG
jgi:hypothetical protein